MPDPITFADRVDFDAIQSLARAVLAQLSPLTGTRATATLRIVNATGDAVVLPPNVYLVPVVGNDRADDLLFKTARDPATALAHNQGGNWTVPDGTSEGVIVTSNVGGARHNLAAGTPVLFDPPIEGLTATLATPGVGGTDAAIVRRANYFEELDGARLERDLHAARVNTLPGVVIVWSSSEPAEGRTSGLSQGSTRIADGVRIFRETFDLFVIAASLGGDERRRNAGLVALQAVTRLLTDQRANRDGEALAAIGGLEIVGRDRFARSERTYAYRLQLRVSRLDTITPNVDPASYPQWLTTQLDVALPGREAPEPDAPLTLWSGVVDMT